MGGVTSGESRRLEYYAKFLDDGRLSPEERAQIARHLNFLLGAGAADPEEARQRFLPFVRQTWPKFIEGPHHHVMAEVFERVERGELKRVIINLPPRSTKSKFSSVLFPAWFLGKHPDAKIMEASHTASLSLDFGRELRNLINSEEYRRIFSVTLAPDARAAWRWNTNAGGQYFAVGKSGAAAGRGGDLIIIDDPHSEQAVIENSKEEFKKTWAWYLAGPRQRLQPGGSIVVVMTRWGESDLTGQLLRQAIEDEEGEQWELIELPAILPSGESLFPGFWPVEELRRTKATLPTARWMANYQQSPTSDEGALIKRDWWRDYPDHQNPSPIDVKVMAWDTAFSAKTTADRSAMVLWGTFAQRNGDGNIQQGIILLDAFAARLDFPALKMKALEMQDLWRPDYLLIENKGTGTPLIQAPAAGRHFRAGGQPASRQRQAHADQCRGGLVQERPGVGTSRIAVGGAGARRDGGLSAR
jgi:hypothetical protein